MPNIASYTVQCAICDRKSKQQYFMSYSIFGNPDLDFRPPPMFRNTMESWIHECPYCGYINTKLNEPCDLSLKEILDAHHEIESGFDWGQFPEKLHDVIRYTLAHTLKMKNGCDEAAERFLNSTLWDNFEALRFAKLGAMLAKSNDHHGAAEQFLRVAWFYDDQGKEQEATHWRKMSIEQVEIVLNRPQAQVSEELICIYADMLRRVGDFNAVLQLDENHLCETSYIMLLRYQKELSKNEDRSAHKINKENALVAEKYQRGMYFSL